MNRDMAKIVTRAIKACESNDVEILKECVKQGYDVKYEEEWAISCACTFQSWDCIDYLISIGADIETAKEYSRDKGKINSIIKKHRG